VTNVLRPPYIPTQNKVLLPQGSLSTPLLPSVALPHNQVGQMPERRNPPAAIASQQASSLYGQNVRSLGGQVSNLQQPHLGLGQQATGLAQQQGLGHTHQQGLGHAHQQGVGHAHQQGIGHGHQQGIGHVHQQGLRGNARQLATGHAQQLGLGVIQQQGSSGHAQLGLRGSGQLQQQRPANVLQPSIQPSGQPQIQATPIGAAPNQSHTQFPPLLQSRSTNQLQLQQQQQQQQQQLLTGHAQNLIQIPGRPQFQSQTSFVARQAHSSLNAPLQTTPINRNQPHIAGLVQTPLLQGRNLGSQQVQGQGSQTTLLTGATGQNFSPAQTHLSSTQRVLMQPSLQGTPLQSASVPNQPQGPAPAATHPANVAGNLHVQVCSWVGVAVLEWCVAEFNV